MAKVMVKVKSGHRLAKRARAIRMGRSRIGRPIRQPVQFFKRTQYISSAISVAPNPVPGFRFGAYSFNLAGVPGNADFVTLYDQYKINFIKWTLIPRWTSVEMNPTTGSLNNSTSVMTVLDYDDVNTPTSIDQLTQYQNLRMTRGGTVHKRAFKPRMLQNVYRGALLPDGHASVKSQWNDVTYTDVVFYGVKYAIQENANLGQEFDLKIDYYLAMKNVR